MLEKALGLRAQPAEETKEDIAAEENKPLKAWRREVTSAKQTAAALLLFAAEDISPLGGTSAPTESSETGTVNSSGTIPSDCNGKMKNNDGMLELIHFLAFKITKQSIKITPPCALSIRI